MQPHAPLEYATPRSAIPTFRRRFRHVIILLAILFFSLYTLAYGTVRHTHTQHWYDKVADQSVPYTMFDANSRLDSCLYILFWPASTIDHLLTTRWSDYDKW